MSYQAYLDSIRAKTGMGPDDFRELAREKGFLAPAVKAGTIVAWLKDEFALGHGHAMAIVAILRADGKARPTIDAALAGHFKGGRAHWQPLYEAMIEKTSSFGTDIAVNAGKTYISLLRGSKKFAIVQTTAGRFDVGLKLKGVDATDRLTPAGTWNAMVTHRVCLADTGALDDELVRWLRQAYDKA